MCSLLQCRNHQTLSDCKYKAFISLNLKRQVAQVPKTTVIEKHLNYVISNSIIKVRVFIGEKKKKTKLERMVNGNRRDCWEKKKKKQPVFDVRLIRKRLGEF